MTEPNVKNLDAATVAYLAMKGAYSQIPEGYGTLYGWAQATGLVPAGMPCAVYLTDPATVPESEAAWELWAPVAGQAEATGPDERGRGVKHIPAMQVACVTHTGPYEEIEPAYRSLAQWVAAQGYEMSGPPMEVYFSDPAEVPPEEYITEIRFPVVKR